MLKKYSAILALLLLTVGIYSQVANHEFLNYDDDVFVTVNQYVRQGFSAQSVKWAFEADLVFDSTSADYWQPMTILSRLFDVQIFGLNPAGHHLMNLLYHVLNIFLLLVLLVEITGSFWMAWCVAIIFAIHPLQVQAVCWVSARKDLLSTLFSLAALTAYVRNKKSSMFGHLTAFVFLLLGIMSKPAAAAIPLLMILIDMSKGQSLVAAGKKTWAFLIISVAAFIILFGGKSGVSIDVPKEIQFYNIAFNFREYISKFILPLQLSIYSRIPDAEFSFLKSGLIYTALGSVTIWCAQKRGKFPFIFLGWFWFVCSIAPSIVLTRADRFMYSPLIGLSLVGVSSVDQLLKRKRYLFLKVLGVMIVLGALLPITYHQCNYWKDNITLFKRALDLDPQNYRAHNNLASAYSTMGKDEEAILHYTDALQISPNYSQAHHNLAVILARKENFKISEFHYLRAIEANPTFALAYINLGHLYMEVEEYGKAVDAYAKSLAIEPDSEVGHNCLANALAKLGDYGAAYMHYEEALKINPRFSQAHHDWGFALAKQDRLEEAKEHFVKALEIDPNYGDAHNKLGVVLAKEGDHRNAIKEFEEALRLNPDDKFAAHNLKLASADNYENLEIKYDEK